MAHQRTFTHGALTITIHTATGADELNAEVLDYRMRMARAARAGVPAENYTRAGTDKYQDDLYIRVITQTDEIQGEADFALCTPMSTADELLAGCEALMATTGGLVTKWRGELNAVNAAPTTNEVAADPKGEPLTSGQTSDTSTSGSQAGTATSPARKAKSQK